MTSTGAAMSQKIVLALGLMSGTSLDGIDAALLETDGDGVVTPIGALTEPYEAALRERLRACLGRESRDSETNGVEQDMTLAHAGVVEALLRASGRSASDVHVVGFHGHTLLHRPERRWTWQLGDAALLASRIGIDVVGDFRTADVQAGGQGAPLAPAFHAALAASMDKPVAVLNLGGVGNVTWVGPGTGQDRALVAFDTGPGNALIDDWMRRTTGKGFDQDGQAAAAGTVDQAALAALLAHPYFTASPPKSLDRDEFDMGAVDGLTAEDGAATLTAFTVTAVARAADLLPAPPVRWLVTGGGRHNPTLMAMLSHALSVPVMPVESAGWDGDALEAQAFAYLAVRSQRGLPLSWPGTTGVPQPQTGGRLFTA
jgi:anhydro-N-acetylmuramic acid kinase